MKLLRRLASPGTDGLTLYARRSLRAPLALGAIAVAVTLCLPAPQYMSLQKPEAADSESPAGKKANATDGPRELPVEVRALESSGSVPTGADPEQTEAMTRRMAANILLRSGYLANANVMTDPQTGSARYAGAVRGEITGCASRYVVAPDPTAVSVPAPAPAPAAESAPAALSAPGSAPAAESDSASGPAAASAIAPAPENKAAINQAITPAVAPAIAAAPAVTPGTAPTPGPMKRPPPQPAQPAQLPLEALRAGQLAIAVVAVEKFNRNELQRRAEWLYANALLASSGRLPDLSLGPAQIRPSTIRRAAGTRGSNPALRKLAGDDPSLGRALADECLSLGLAAAVLESLACSDCEDAERHAVMAYAGQRRRTDAAGDYTAVVEAIAAMME